MTWWSSDKKTGSFSVCIYTANCPIKAIVPKKLKLFLQAAWIMMLATIRQRNCKHLKLFFMVRLLKKNVPTYTLCRHWRLDSTGHGCIVFRLCRGFSPSSAWLHTPPGAPDIVDLLRFCWFGHFSLIFVLPLDWCHWFYCNVDVMMWYNRESVQGVLFWKLTRCSTPFLCLTSCPPHLLCAAWRGFCQKQTRRVF